MKYEDFEKFVRSQCHYETMYYDSEGRLMLITTMLDAYGMLNKAAVPTTLINVNGVLEQAGYIKKKEWQGLTDEDKIEIQLLKWWDFEDTFDLDGYTRAIEAKLKEKNT